MKKIISVLLCAVFVLSFVGCSKDNSDNKDSEADYSKMITIDSHYKAIGDDVISIYKRLCEAVINYEASVKLSAIDIDNITQLFYTSFPLYSLVGSIDFSEDKTGLVIRYNLSDEEHKKSVDSFFNKIDEIRRACGHGVVSKDEFAKNAYRYICKNFSLDNSVTTVFDCVIAKKGMSSSLSGLFEYLLLLEDIDASHIIKSDKNGNVSMLTLAIYNGKECLFDIASEMTKSDDGEKYFATDIKKALSGDDTLTHTDGTQLIVLPDESELE